MFVPAPMRAGGSVRGLVVAALAAAAVVSSGCASSGRSSRPAADRGPDVTVRVENRGTRPLTILFSRAGQLIRLGDVGSVRTAVFRLRPRDLAEAGSEKYLVARTGPSGTSVRSERLIVQPGQVVTWVLPEQLGLGSLIVR